MSVSDHFVESCKIFAQDHFLCDGIRSYWGVEDAGIVTAKADEQKTEKTRNKILALVKKL